MAFMQTLLENVPPQKSCALIIDLKAIQENYQALQGFVREGVVCGAVLKADAYGLGQDEVGGALYKVGCRDFFFAYLDEAIQGRQAFPQSDVNTYVFNGVFPGTEKEFLEYNLIPCLISLEQVERWARFAREQNKKLPCLLHIDTGMGREGISQRELEHLVAGDLLENFDIRYVMSHMANSNNSGAPKNEVQLERFLKAKSLVPTTKASLATFANSSGITLGKNYQFDLVRPGMALYGYKNENYGTLLDLKPCLKVFARIILTRKIPQGESIGYNCTHVCKRDTKVALVAIGHRDGILRAVSNKGSVLINGKNAPIIGTVSMDVLMADVTDQPDEVVHSNMWAEIYGDVTSTRAFAENQGTSVYELLVRHGTRYHRIYANQ